MENAMAQKVWEFANQFVGATICAENDSECRQLTAESRHKASQHEWLYHCTTADGVLSILKSNEFWLTNLQAVNDKEEAGRINIPSYEKSYYVGCFSFDPDIPKEHWEEYGTLANGVVIGVKKEWFVRKPIFMTTSYQKCEGSNFRIFKTHDEALDYAISQKTNGVMGVDPYHIFDFGFYQIIYDDELKKSMLGMGTIDIHGNAMPIRSISPQIPGIIKSCAGWCQRSGCEPYWKNWETEKEVRLKVGIHRLSQSMNIESQKVPDVYFRQVVIPLVENAFNTIRIAFSPNYSNRDTLLETIRITYPNRKIEVMN